MGGTTQARRSGSVSAMRARMRSNTAAELVRPARANAAELADLNAVGIIAKPMFTEHLLAFELTAADGDGSISFEEFMGLWTDSR